MISKINTNHHNNEIPFANKHSIQFRNHKYEEKNKKTEKINKKRTEISGIKTENFENYETEENNNNNNDENSVMGKRSENFSINSIEQNKIIKLKFERYRTAKKLNIFKIKKNIFLMSRKTKQKL
jgi:hypothetical protein